jgi:hypothetical protein
MSDLTWPEAFFLVPTLRVGTRVPTLRVVGVEGDMGDWKLVPLGVAERPVVRSHPERGNEERSEGELGERFSFACTSGL